MRIRFKEMLASGVDGFPFMPGQVIDVAKPGPWLLSYVDGIRAERLDDDVATEPEPAVSDPIAVENAVDAPVEKAATRFGRTRRQK